MTYQTLELNLEPPLATVRFHRPERLNAFSEALVSEVIDALRKLRDDDAIRVVILCGGGRAFSTGYDISGDDEENTHLSVAEYNNSLQYCYDYAFAIWDFPKPTIAAVHGYALGGACEIAMLCDLTIASDDCRFGEPENRFAMAPPVLIMPWVVPMKAAKELLYSGRLISAQRAYEIGMVNEVVPRSELEKRARDHALLISRVPPLAVQLAKEAINRTYEVMGLRSAFEHSRVLGAIVDVSETDEGRQFMDVRREEGLRAALDWRGEQFRELDDALARSTYDEPNKG